MNENIKKIKKTFNDKEFNVLYQKGQAGYQLWEIKQLRAAGLEKILNRTPYHPQQDRRDFEVEPGIICRRDLSMTLRDGARIFFDLYLSKEAYETKKPLPLIIAWGFFGKRRSESMTTVNVDGCPDDSISNICKFEGPDPTYWCYNDYAIANVDSRGVVESEGDVSPWGSQDGQDGYDFIEWAAHEEWCTGKVSMYGNSALAMHQWYIAAERPPHLACFAPWEGTGDLYREWLRPGGIPAVTFMKRILGYTCSNNYFEDIADMVDEYPFYNEYWEDKTPRYGDIEAPCYITGGWCHIHLRAAVEAYRTIPVERKWIRIHREFEWADGYKNENLEDLKKFFDRYMKNIRNGWEFTPKVRIDVMDAYHYDLCHNRPETGFPLERTEYKKLYLDAAALKAGFNQPIEQTEATYNPNNEILSFKHKFEEDTEITGFMKLRLWVESRGFDDMDLFIWLKKYNAEGQYIPVSGKIDESDGDYRGAWGFQRVSRRELDEVNSTEYRPVLTHKTSWKLSKGEIVPVDIEIWPHSRFFHRGEILSIEITGRFIESTWFEDHKVGYQYDNGNATHVVHTGGKYDSHLLFPFIPPRYVSGDFFIR